MQLRSVWSRSVYPVIIPSRFYQLFKIVGNFPVQCRHGEEGRNRASEWSSEVEETALPPRSGSRYHAVTPNCQIKISHLELLSRIIIFWRNLLSRNKYSSSASHWLTQLWRDAVTSSRALVSSLIFSRVASGKSCNLSELEPSGCWQERHNIYLRFPWVALFQWGCQIFWTPNLSQSYRPFRRFKLNFKFRKS